MEVLKVCHINIGDTIASKERETHEIEKIYADSLIRVLKHLIIITILLSCICCFKT